MATENKIKSLLIELGISTENSIVPFHPKVRDRDDVSVLKCQKSDVILLSRSDHINPTYYSGKDDFAYWNSKDRKAALLSVSDDTDRRANQFKQYVTNRKWLDIGTGAGGILDVLSHYAKETTAIEPQTSARNNLTDLGYKVFSSIDDLTENDYEVVTLFHVLEHLTDPIETLKQIRSRMVKGGKIIIEVPHARDFLISFLENEAFKDSTFWSEHLILHTRDSLSVFMKASGFTKIIINGFQRHPLANHLYWLKHNKPGGHNKWQYLRTSELEHSYSEMLNGIDKTDTLIAVAEN
jgi:SAM-dependent methyltransferase